MRILVCFSNALIAKSQLYDKLRSKEVTADKNDQYLVNFERDSDGVSYIRNEVEDHYSEEENSDPESDWLVFSAPCSRLHHDAMC